MVERLIPKCLNALLFVHNKARLLVEAYYEVEHLKEDIAKLRNDYHLMLTSLKNRTSVNNLLYHCMKTKKKAMEDLKNWGSFKDQFLIDNSELYIAFRN